MVHNNSQDENIPLLTEVWPWSMSRDLFTNFHARFILIRVPFSPFGKLNEKDSEIIAMPHTHFYDAHVLCPHVSLHSM